MYLWKLFMMDKRMKKQAEDAGEQLVFEEDPIVAEPKPQEPEIEKPKPEPVDPTVVFLQSFLGRFGSSIQPEIRECFYNGGHQFAVTYDGGGMADSGWEFYDGNTYASIEGCGGFTPEPMPQDSLCRTALPMCTTIYKPSVSYVNSSGVQVTSSGVDTYDLD